MAVAEVYLIIFIYGWLELNANACYVVLPTKMLPILAAKNANANIHIAPASQRLKKTDCENWNNLLSSF